jgi:hypothetical protein
MANRVHTAMDSVKLAGHSATADSAGADTKLTQLGKRDHAMLGGGQRREPPLAGGVARCVHYFVVLSHTP